MDRGGPDFSGFPGGPLDRVGPGFQLSGLAHIGLQYTTLLFRGYIYIVGVVAGRMEIPVHTGPLVQGGRNGQGWGLPLATLYNVPVVGSFGVWG